jgi:hypothetical protein
MSKLFVLLMASAILMACNNQQQEGHEGHADHQHATESAPVATPAAETPSGNTGLVLNNGAKWKADAATNQNVVLLRQIISGPPPLDHGGYQQAAEKLQEGLNKMVKECAMKGPDHEALHQWLVPLMGKVKALKNAGSAAHSDTVYKEIVQQINRYSTYFE